MQSRVIDSSIPQNKEDDNKKSMFSFMTPSTKKEEKEEVPEKLIKNEETRLNRSMQSRVIDASIPQNKEDDNKKSMFSLMMPSTKKEEINKNK